MILFLFNENRFSCFVAEHLLVGQLCTNPKSNRSLLSCLKVTQCSTSEIEDAPLYNSCLYQSRLGFRRSATTLYPSPLTWTCWTTSFGHTSRTSPTWPPPTPKPAWSPPSTKLLPALVEKACSQLRIRIEAVIEAWRWLHWIDVRSTT